MPVPDIAPSFPLLMSLSVRMTCFSHVFPPHKQVSINSTWWFYMLLECRCKGHEILPITMQFIRLIDDCHSPPPCRIPCIRSPQFVPQMDSEQFSVWRLSWPMQPWTIFHMPRCVVGGTSTPIGIQWAVALVAHGFQFAFPRLPLPEAGIFSL